MSEDLELKRLKLKKMMQLASMVGQVKAEQQPKPASAETPLEVVKKHLGPRGDEVLQAAYEQYPRETAAIVEKLAQLIKLGQITEPIDGGELYNLFRSLGLRIKLETKITYVKRGEAKDLKELFKQ
ncbi:MAG: DNA-binding protein [Candidatus Caldarchaeum sp.]|uniref:Double-stranded DNA-binding protein n=1 Tax=Caldiarchaeum subterraneum TaxID=311458 RepID=A0A7C4I468_CALS0